MSVESNSEVQSPCIGVCVVDETSQLCQGCFRTLNEIEGWWNLDNTQKKAVAEDASQRATALFD
jgi:uncharacterized protein